VVLLAVEMTLNKRLSQRDAFGIAKAGLSDPISKPLLFKLRCTKKGANKSAPFNISIF
jgi:hypothetical protein